MVSRVIIDDGMKFDRMTGILIGPFLEPDQYNVYSAPLFIYNRSDRFTVLCYRAMPGPHTEVCRVVKMFQQLEDVWNVSKDKYKPRKYFLSQKLLCKELCCHLEFRCLIYIAIQDKTRLAAQMIIYHDLFSLIKNTLWQPACISDVKQNHINSDQVPNYHLLDDKSRHTRCEMLEQKMISRHQWHSNSVNWTHAINHQPLPWYGDCGLLYWSCL